MSIILCALASGLSFLKEAPTASKREVNEMLLLQAKKKSWGKTGNVLQAKKSKKAGECDFTAAKTLVYGPKKKSESSEKQKSKTYKAIIEK